MSEELQGNVRSIVTVKLDQLARMHKSTVEKVDDLSDKLLNPEHGLFIKIKDVENTAGNASDAAGRVETELDKLVEVSMNQTLQLQLIESWKEDRDERDEELRELVSSLANSMQVLTQDLDRRMGIKKWTDKFIWLVIALVLGGLAANLKSRYTELTNLNEMKQLIERQEQRDIERIKAAEAMRPKIQPTSDT